MTPLANFLSRLSGVTACGRGFSARCPAHDDRQASLSVKEGEDGRVLIHCHARCAPSTIVERLGLQMSDLFVSNGKASNGKASSSKVVDTVYTYCAETGSVLYQVVRFKPKDFRQRKPNGRPGGWIWNLDGVERVPYRLPELLDAVKNYRRVFIVEGEKDAESLVALGLDATCNSGGAGKWNAAFAKYFHGARVAVIPDNDKPGREHAEQIARSLDGVAAQVKVVTLPHGKDATDWIALDSLAEQVRALEPSSRGSTRTSRATLNALVWKTANWTPTAAVPGRTGEGEADVQENDLADKGKGKSKGKEKKPAQGTLCLKLATAAGVGLFHDAAGDCFADLPTNGLRDTTPLRSSGFRAWLAHAYHVKYGGAPSSQALADATNTLEGMARFDGPEHTVNLRVACDAEALYVDLADAEKHVVKITADGWTVEQSKADPGNMLPRFRTPRGMLALPVPIRGGNVRELWTFFPVIEKQRPLLAGSLVSALCASGPYTIGVFIGPQGGGKSTVTKTFKKMTDPAAADARSSPKDAHDMAIGARGNHVLSFDNLSYLPPWLPDFLCILSTAGTYSTRRLYTDSEESFFTGQRPLLINSIVDFLVQPDLVSRCVFFKLRPLHDSERLSEDAYWAAFEEARPRLLGVLCDTLAAGMRKLPSIPKDGWPRMTTFCRWGTACEEALGFKSGDFMMAYTLNQLAATKSSLDSHSIYAPLLECLDLEGGKLDLPATRLLENLRWRSAEAWKAHDWPKKAHFLSSQLKRMQPGLAAMGIKVTFMRRNDQRHIRIEREPEASQW
jgi:hypothetical protein